MRATQACRIIGYALEEANEEGVIQVFANTSEHTVSEIARLRAELATLWDTVDRLEERLQQARRNNTEETDARVAVLKEENVKQREETEALKARLTALENALQREVLTNTSLAME